MLFVRDEDDAHQARVHEYIVELESRISDLRAISHMIQHDVRNSLNAIQVWCSTLRKAGSLGPLALQSGLTDIEAICQHMAMTVGGFLALVDLEHDPTSIQEVDLDPLVQSVIVIVSGRFPGIPFRLKTDFQAPTLPTRLPHLRQIVENLVVNAFKYRDSTRPELKLSVRSQQMADRIELAIRDNGLGIPLDAQSEVFQLFKRAHEGEGEGGGVGLAIVKRLVEANSGTIRLQSEPGQGTTFVLSFPTREALRESAAHEAHAARTDPVA
jgi:signal transduction histidine kinase